MYVLKIEAVYVRYTCIVLYCIIVLYAPVSSLLEIIFYMTTIKRKMNQTSAGIFNSW